MRQALHYFFWALVLTLSIIGLSLIPKNAEASDLIGHGTGYFITDDGIGVTNVHVADPLKVDMMMGLFVKNLEIMANVNGVKYPIQIIAEDVANDVVIFKVMGIGKTKGLPVSATLPKQGADVMLVGYGITPLVSYSSFGTFNGGFPLDRSGGASLETATILMYPGHSGSPLIANGQVVGTVEGVPIAANAPMLGYSLFITENVVTSLAKTANIHLKTLTIIQGLVFNSLSKQQQIEVVKQSVFSVELYGDVITIKNVNE